MEKKISLIFVLLFFVNFSFADNYIDSLKNLIKVSDDSVKTEIYLNLLETYSSDSLEQLIDFAEKSRLSSEMAFNDSIQASVLNRIGLIFYSKSNYTLAEKYFSFSLEKEIELKNNLNIAKMYSNIAVTKELKGDYEDAIDKYLTALEYFEKEDYKKGIAFVYNNLGVVYDEMKRKDESLKFKLKSLEIKKEINDSLGMASTLNNLGVVYEELIQNYDSALYYYSLALDIYLKLNQTINYAVTLQNIAAVKKVQGFVDDALSAYNKALEIFTTENNLQGQAWSYRNIGEILIGKSKFNEAEIILKSGLVISEQIEDKKTELEITGLTADLFYKTADFKNAADYYLKYNILNDSLINTENQKQINELETKFQTSQLEYQIEILNKDNSIKSEKIKINRLIILGLILTTCLILTISFFLRKLLKLENQRQKQNLEQKVLRLQMNPHFISNALSSIQNFMFENKPQEAANYLSDFTRLMRQTIKFTSNDFVTLDEEIEALKDYLKIQQMRFSDLFDFEFNISNQIETEFIKIPPMIIQPFVENSIKHGFEDIDYKGKIDINFNISENILCIEVIDNGKGIDFKSDTVQNHISYSLQITKDRLKNMNKTYKKNASVKIIDKFENNRGVKVEINIPVI